MRPCQDIAILWIKMERKIIIPALNEAEHSQWNEGLFWYELTQKIAF